MLDDELVVVSDSPKKFTELGATTATDDDDDDEELGYNGLDVAPYGSELGRVSLPPGTPNFLNQSKFKGDANETCKSKARVRIFMILMP